MIRKRTGRNGVTPSAAISLTLWFLHSPYLSTLLPSHLPRPRWSNVIDVKQLITFILWTPSQPATLPLTSRIYPHIIHFPWKNCMTSAARLPEYMRLRIWEGARAGKQGKEVCVDGSTGNGSRWWRAIRLTKRAFRPVYADETLLSGLLRGRLFPVVMKGSIMENACCCIPSKIWSL